MFFSWCCKHCGFLQRISCVISILSKKTARDPTQCVGSKRIVYYNDDEYDDADEDGDDDDNDDDDVH
jgi:hypothetical protein